jgi:hypothetical protein
MLMMPYASSCCGVFFVRPALRRDLRCLILFDQFYDILHTPERLRGSGRHRWGHTQGLMDAHEIVPDGVEGEGMARKHCAYS